MKILLHICCGPCAIYCADNLQRSGDKVEGFFYNPNIHPINEYDKRKEAVVKVSEKLNLPVHFCADYNFDDYFMAIAFNNGKDRCPLCWQLRLKETAKFAKTNGFDAFTTTLLISPYQDHNKIKDIAAQAAKDFKVDFYYQDFRPGFGQSHKLSKEMQLYHQKYCGCVYSEKERRLATGAAK